MILDNFLYKINLYRHHWGFYASQLRFLRYGKLPHLTHNEKQQIQKTWPSLTFHAMDYIWHRIYKKEYGFSPYFMGEMQVWYMLEKLNPYDQVVSLQHKALCDVYFPNIPYPKTIIRCINGSLYSRDMHIITINEALTLIHKADSFIIKPSIETLQGNGVKKIHSANIHDIEELKNLFHSIGDNFILQHVVKQHPDIEKLNPTSLNTCRITSILLNNRFLTSTNIKVGKLNSIKDNWNSSYFINVDENGYFSEYGYDYYLNRVYKTDNGFIFKGLKMPFYNKMLEFVEQTHRAYFPQCGVIGWDITIDNNDEISVIELNLTCPGIAVEQLASGDFLKPIAKEINNVIKLRNYHTYRKNIL